MSKEEVLVTPYGEMIDMINCELIENGAKQKQPKLTQEEIWFG